MNAGGAGKYYLAVTEGKAKETQKGLLTELSRKKKWKNHQKDSPNKRG